MRGECPEKRPTNPAALAALPIRFDTVLPVRRPKDGGAGGSVRAVDRPKLRRGVPADVQGGSVAVLVTLRAAHRDPGGSVAPELHVGPGERGGLATPEHGVPDDRDERHVHAPAALLRRPAGEPAHHAPDAFVVGRIRVSGFRVVVADRGAVHAERCG